MKCPKCGTIYNITNGRCFGCGYPEICDWCKKPLNRKKDWWCSFHGKPPYPFTEGLEIKELTSSKSLWFICKGCCDKNKNVKQKDKVKKVVK